MFIELTDHLRCPADHDESYLVLLPDRMEDRSVREGRLGCPVCGRTYMLADGVLDLGGAARPSRRPRRCSSRRPLTALVGLSGPGGYLVLVGRPAARWREVAELNPGVGAGRGESRRRRSRDAPGISVLRGGSLPLKSRSMRGVVLGKSLRGRPGLGRRGGEGGVAGPAGGRGGAGARRPTRSS